MWFILTELKKDSMFDFLNSFIELLYLELRTGSTPYFPKKVDMDVCNQLVPGTNFALNLTQIPKRNPLTKYLYATTAADVPNKKGYVRTWVGKGYVFSNKITSKDGGVIDGPLEYWFLPDVLKGTDNPRSSNWYPDRP